MNIYVIVCCVLWVAFTCTVPNRFIMHTCNHSFEYKIKKRGLNYLKDIHVPLNINLYIRLC